MSDEPFRRSPTGITVSIPPLLRSWLIAQAQAAAAGAVQLGDPVHRRLLGPIDPTEDHDDPLTELQRQFAVEGPLSLLVATAEATEISEEEAEQWIQGLQLILAASAARLAVVTEDDVAALDEVQHGELTTIQALISLLIDALDG
jgi:hypothetical protein